MTVATAAAMSVGDGDVEANGLDVLDRVEVVEILLRARAGVDEEAVRRETLGDLAADAAARARDEHGTLRNALRERVRRDGGDGDTGDHDPRNGVGHEIEAGGGRQRENARLLDRRVTVVPIYDAPGLRARRADRSPARFDTRQREESSPCFVLMFAHSWRPSRSP